MLVAVFSKCSSNDFLILLQEKLKPLMDQLNRVKDLPVPEFRSLQDWEVQAYAAARSNADANDNDPSKSTQSYNGIPMPSLGETKVQNMLIMPFIILLMLELFLPKFCRVKSQAYLISITMEEYVF